VQQMPDRDAYVDGLVDFSSHFCPALGQPTRVPEIPAHPDMTTHQTPRSLRIDRAAVSVVKASFVALVECYPFRGILG
jgi:hypothetical protein